MKFFRLDVHSWFEDLGGYGRHFYAIKINDDHTAIMPVDEGMVASGHLPIRMCSLPTPEWADENIRHFRLSEPLRFLNISTQKVQKARYILVIKTRTGRFIAPAFKDGRDRQYLNIIWEVK